MKIRFALLFFCFAALLIIACKHNIDDTIDCVTEGILAKIDRVFDSTDRSTVDLTLNYTGKKTIKSINWNFGDGNSQTTNDVSTTHTYSDTGTYTIKASVNLEQGSSICTITPQRDIRIKP